MKRNTHQTFLRPGLWLTLLMFVVTVWAFRAAQGRTYTQESLPHSLDNARPDLRARGTAANVPFAATIMVNSAAMTIANNGVCTLPEAINNANQDSQSCAGCSTDCAAGSGTDTIVLQANTVYTLTASLDSTNYYGFNGLPVITSAIILEGNGAIIERSSAANTPTFRLFAVAKQDPQTGAALTTPGSLTLRNVTLRGGLAQGGNGSSGGGGAAGLGGAILNQGQLIVEASSLVLNQAVGGNGSIGGGGGGGGGLSGPAVVTQVGLSNNGGPPNGGNAGTTDGSPGGNGGIGGGGGGGQTGIQTSAGSGGKGGFGGGGGAGGYSPTVGGGAGGDGGFGGGGGGAGDGGGICPSSDINGGIGGFGGGNGGANNRCVALGQSRGGGGAGLGGAVFNDGGSLTMTNSTISGNQAQAGLSQFSNGGVTMATDGQGLGGGIFARNGTVTLINATLSNNVASEGGSLYLFGDAQQVRPNDSTTITYSIRNTIIANTSGGATDVFVSTHPTNGGTVISGTNGNNLVELNGPGANGIAAASIVSSDDPNLGFLQYAGGPTPVHPLLSGSPALDAGDSSVAGAPFNLTTDQRGAGFSRQVGSKVDIGAFEYRCFANPVVTSINDNVPGSLRQDIVDACPGSTITFNLPINQTITLKFGELTIEKNLTIQGPGAQLLTISGNNQSRVFRIVEDLLNVTLSGLTIANGHHKTPDVLINGLFVGAERAYGGGIYTQSSGTVNVTNCVLTNNWAEGGNATGINSQNVAAGFGLGGAICHRSGIGTLNVAGCLLTNNQATTGTASGGEQNFAFPSRGGAIFTELEAAMTITRSTISGNSSTQGAGIYTNGALTVTDTTISNNRGGDWGGGANVNTFATAALTNTTISGNTVGDGGLGAGLAAAAGLGGLVVLTNCTITDNHGGQYSFGGGLYGTFNPFTNLKNTIIAGNTATEGPDVYRFAHTLGNNLIGNGDSIQVRPAGGGFPYSSGMTNGVNGDQVGTAAAPLDPKLGPLADNGGPTQTHRPLPGSSAINAGMSNGAPTTDQRGVARPQNGAVDIGALEAAFTLAATGGTPQTTTLGAPFAAPLLATLTENGMPLANVPLLFAAPVNGASATFPNGPMVNTNAQGQASVNAVANFVLGSYVVQATSPGVPPATFNLTNICPTITFVPASLPAATINVAYPTTLSATPNGTYNFAVTSGLLPTGLTLNSNGTFSGAPIQSGTFNFRVMATGFGSCSSFRDYTLVVSCPGVTLDATPLPAGTIGANYNQLRAASPTGSYSYAVSSGALPVGLTLNASTGAITGTPTAAGTFTFTITATAGACSGQQSYSLTIACAGITLASLANSTAGVNYAGSVAASPAGTYSYSLVQGSLPSGLTLNTTSGALTGLPTITGTYTFTIKAQTNNGCSGQQTYTLTINCPTITLSVLPTPTLNSLYNQTLAASPSGGNYSFAVTAGALPVGLSLNAATGAITGTPTAAGAYNFTLTASGFGACTGSRAYTGTIAGSSCPTISLPELPSGQPGQLYSQSVAASPSGTYSYAVISGSLPPGLTLYGSAGLLFGYPTTAGTFNFTVTANNAASCSGSKNYSLVIGGAAVRALVFGDFDGDGKADLSVWRGASGEWLTINSGTRRSQSTSWGAATAPYFDVPTPGDYDGDGKMDLAVFRKSTGEWLITGSKDGAITTKVWGLGSDVPVPGDYDGDGKTDIAVWRGADTNWYILRSSDGQVQTVSWGTSKAPYNDLPVPADYDGDGKTDVAVFRQQNGHWYIRQSSDGSVMDKSWGLGTDVPVAADYDGDGKADIAVWRGADTNWYIVQSSDQTVKTISWGTSALGDVPAPGDYDGDGKADAAVWRASNNTWFVKCSRDANVLTQPQGQTGDWPITGWAKF